MHRFEIRVRYGDTDQMGDSGLGHGRLHPRLDGPDLRDVPGPAAGRCRSAAGCADLRQRVRESFIKRIGVKNVLVLTDAEIALYATTFGKSGLVVIAGTGSVCLGKNDAGKIAISGGWGPLAGDEGGGVGIAREALHAVAKASDGRGKATELSERAVLCLRSRILTMICSA